MRNYDYNKLLDSRTFEYLAKDIIEVRENKEFEIFSEVKDKGIDLRNIENGFSTIVQVKRYKDFKSLYNQLKNTELEKVKKLKPDRYIIITSSPISVENKNQIKELFKDCNLEEKDIIGCEALNSIIEGPEYKKVEDEYYQLWINSTRTLEGFIKKNLNAGTYAYTKQELEEIRQSAKIYVKHDNFKEALRIIKQKKCLLICGEPEIGKSTLARNLCAYLMNQNKELEFVYDTKLSKILNLFDDKPQLFFVDDFWGSRFDGNLNAEEENDLKRTIEMISKSNNKILILTSREYILEQGYAKYPELEEFFDSYKLNLHIEDYSNLFKARILFKHLEKSNLPTYGIHQIANGYEWIINNENYRPRLIENYINYVGDKEIEPINYLKDFREYLDHPYKLWKEIFEKQQEGAQIITILMLLLNQNYMKLKDVRTLYEKYIDIDTKTQARKKDFLKCISQLENTLITTYVEDYIPKKDVFVKFKNSSIELYIYKHLIENIGEYGKNIIEATPYINTLMYLIGSWNILNRYQEEIAKEEKVYYDLTNNKELVNHIKQKIMRDFEKLVFINEDIFRGYSESDEYYVHKLIICIDLYKQYPSDDFKDFIQERVIDVLNKLEKEKYFDYDDLFSIPDLVYKAKSEGIYTKVNPNKIIEDIFNAIRFSSQINTLKYFEEKFPKEYKEFYDKNKGRVISLIYNLTLDDADFFMSDDMDDEIDTLIDMTIPQLFERFDLKYNKDYMNEFYEITGRRLLNDRRNKKNIGIDLEYEEIEEYEQERQEEQKEKNMIEEEKEELLDTIYEDEVKEEDIKEFFAKNIENKKIVKELIKLFNNYDKNYIRSFMNDWERIEILTNYINELKRIPKDSKDFFENFIEYIIKTNRGINNSVISKLKELAYTTFKEGRSYIFKRELLEIFDDTKIEELLMSKIIYKIRKKYYFQTIYFHLYLALDKMIQNGDELPNVYTHFELGCFEDLFNDVCYTYSDINLNKFNSDFLLKQIQIVLNETKSNNIHESIKKLVSKYKIEVDLDVDDRWIYTGGSCCTDASLLALEYLGFDTYDMICEPFELEEIKPLFEKAYKTTNANILLEKDLTNKRTLKYKLLDKLGYTRYLKQFYEYLLKCEEILKEKPNINLRMSFEI